MIKPFRKKTCSCSYRRIRWCGDFDPSSKIKALFPSSKEKKWFHDQLIISPPSITNFLFFKPIKTSHIKQNTPQKPFCTTRGLTVVEIIHVYCDTSLKTQQQKSDHATRAEQTRVPFLFSSLLNIL